MRGGKCVPMIALVLLVSACGGAEKASDAAALREPYHEMIGAEMEAEITWEFGEVEMLYTMQCEYNVDGDSTVEVLEPETVAGVKAIFSGAEMQLEYEGECLNAGTLSDEHLSPAGCLPRVMSALRDGWLLEENQETWEDIPCLRLTVDQSGLQDGKILTTLWLRLEDGKPLRGEISVDGEVILTAEFTRFEFCDTL